MRLELYFSASRFSYQIPRMQSGFISVYLAGFMNEYAGRKNYMLMVAESSRKVIGIIQIEYLCLCIDIGITVRKNLNDPF